MRIMRATKKIEPPLPPFRRGTNSRERTTTMAFTCCLCAKTCSGYGNNPAPVDNTPGAQCCNDCNFHSVVPARMLEFLQDEMGDDSDDETILEDSTRHDCVQCKTETSCGLKNNNKEFICEDCLSDVKCAHCNARGVDKQDDEGYWVHEDCE